MARAGGSAARLLLKLDTPEARASTPAPTMFFARFTVLDGTEAPFGSTVPAAAIKLCLAGAAALIGRNAGRDAAISSESPSAGSASRHKRLRWRAASIFLREVVITPEWLNARGRTRGRLELHLRRSF